VSATDVRTGTQELLRYIPFRHGVGIPRVATQDIELDGAVIAAGDFVHVSYLAANRDPAVFDRPDELDFDRADSPPHMTFCGRNWHAANQSPKRRAG
jgi:cytochrome P450